MKTAKIITKRIVNAVCDRDGFLNGFIRGMAGCALVISALMLFVACVG